MDGRPLAEEERATTTLTHGSRADALGGDLRTEMARRITAILLLGPVLEANYEAVKRETWAWPSGQ